MLLLGAAAAPTQDLNGASVTVVFYSAPGCITLTNVGPIDVEPRTFRVTTSTCTPVPSLIQYSSYRAFLNSGTTSGDATCFVTTYADNSCQDVTRVSPAGSPPGDCENILPDDLSDPTAFGARSFSVSCT